MLLKTVKSPIQCLSAPSVIIPTPLKKGLGMHIQMNHRISQPDGIDYSCVGDSEEDDTVNFPDDPKTFVVYQGPQRGMFTPSIYYVFLI